IASQREVQASACGLGCAGIWALQGSGSCAPRAVVYDRMGVVRPRRRTPSSRQSGQNGNRGRRGAIRSRRTRLPLDPLRAGVLPARAVDGRGALAPHTRVATGVRPTEMSDLHMLILGRIAHRRLADVEEIADWLGVSVVMAEALCADLEAAGLLTTAPGH